MTAAFRALRRGLPSPILTPSSGPENRIHFNLMFAARMTALYFSDSAAMKAPKVTGEPSGRLRLFNQSHDVRERGTLAGARHRHAEGAGAVVGAGDDLRAIDLWHWTRFAVISVPVEPASHQSPRKHTTSPCRATKE
jgi:hypothetical protein